MDTPAQNATSRELAHLRHRIDELESEVARLKREVKSSDSPQKKPLWEVLAGQFDGDPVFAEIVKEGRAWREAQRPRRKKKRGERAGR